MTTLLDYAMGCPVGVVDLVATNAILVSGNNGYRGIPSSKVTLSYPRTNA